MSDDVSAPSTQNDDTQNDDTQNDDSQKDNSQNDSSQGDSSQGGNPDAASDETSEGAGSPTGVTAGDPKKYPPMTAQLAGLGAVTAVVLWALRALLSRRSKPPTPQERLVEATSTLGSAAVDLGGRAARRTAAVAQPVARDAAALTVVAAADAAARTAAVAQDAAGRAVEGAGKVAAVAAGGAREIAEGVESVQKAWRKLVTRLIIVVFGGAGYVLGAAAGRERYDQIVGLARRASETVQGGR